jgi:hypothetical protein
MIHMEQQMETLLALLRDAFAQGAKSLSDLMPLPISLDVMNLELCTLPHLELTLNQNVQESQIATIRQSFAGAIWGEGFWLLSYTNALQLTSALSGVRMHFLQLDQSAREVLCEMGNMALNITLGVLRDLLKRTSPSSMPHLYVDSQKALLHSILTTHREHQALLATILFRQGTLTFCMFLVLVCALSPLQFVTQAIK